MTSPNFLSPAHEQLFTEFTKSISARAEFFHAVFENSAMRDHYLALLTAELLQHPLDILELSNDTDILALFNPRLRDIPLATATKITHMSTSGVLLVREAHAIAPNNWNVLFALLRDLPALNLACVACWRPDQQTQQSLVSGYLRGIRPTFRFERDSDGSQMVRE